MKITFRLLLSLLLVILFVAGALSFVQARQEDKRLIGELEALDRVA